MPSQLLVVAPDGALDRERLDLDPLRLAPHGLAGERQPVAVRGPVEEADRQVLLQGGEPAAHRGLRDAEVLRGRGEAAVPRDGEEEAQVVPVEHAASMRIRIPGKRFRSDFPVNLNCCSPVCPMQGAPE